MRGSSTATSEVCALAAPAAAAAAPHITAAASNQLHCIFLHINSTIDTNYPPSKPHQTPVGCNVCRFYVLHRMLHRHFQPSSSPPPSIADDTGFIQPVMCEWPLMAEFQTMQLADYNWLLGTTAQQVRQAV
jgi:hypothetical protein